MNEIMIVLVGEQPAPNLLVVCQGSPLGNTKS